MKKLLIVMGLVAMVAGCSARTPAPTATQTHYRDKITTAAARMHQTAGEKNRMGSVRFDETRAGLNMIVDLRNVRPNVEYKLLVAKPGAAPDAKCTRMNEKLPRVRGDATGHIRQTYLITGLTAAELNGKELRMYRRDAHGRKVRVGLGHIRH